MKSSRRNFLKHLAQTAKLGFGAGLYQQSSMGISKTGIRTKAPAEARNFAILGARKGVDPREYVETVLYTHQEVDQWIAGNTANHEKYDGEIGWIPQPGFANNGIHGCTCEYSYEPCGARRMTAFAGRECRINTYGDSFTHCDQVSDGESWQERLASHLCEPVRNFGVSGNTLYQAYIRMKREEARTPAKYLIFNPHGGGLWGSQSPWASLGMPRAETADTDWRNSERGAARQPRFFTSRRPTVPYVKVNPATGEFAEHPNICATPESLYNLCDLDWTYERFKNEVQLKIILAHENIKRQTPEASYEEITELAQARGIHTRIDGAEELSNALEQISKQAAVFMNRRIVEKIEEYAAVRGKKIFYVISHSVEDLAAALQTEARFDQGLVDFLEARNLPYVDDLDAHRADFSRSKLSVDDYLKQYYIGHYTPLGNFFQAFAIKDKVATFLDPKPIPYRI
jgi:hypothetical protein